MQTSCTSMHFFILCISSWKLWLVRINMQFVSLFNLSWTVNLVEIVMDELNLVKFGFGWPGPGQLWSWMILSWTVMTLDEIVLDDYDPGWNCLGRKWHGWARVDEMPLDELSETRYLTPAGFISELMMTCSKPLTYSGTCSADFKDIFL